MAPTLVKVFLGLVAVLSASSAVSAESHTVSFDNQCVLLRTHNRTITDYIAIGVAMELYAFNSYLVEIRVSIDTCL